MCSTLTHALVHCNKMKIEVIVTRACGVGNNMGEHKGIGRKRSFVDLSWDA